MKGTKQLRLLGWKYKQMEDEENIEKIENLKGSSAENKIEEEQRHNLGLYISYIDLSFGWL